MFALGCVCIYGGYTVGDSSDTQQFNDLHNEARVSRGAGSPRRTNVEKRVVSVRHSLLLYIMATQLWNLAGMSVVLLVPC